MTASSETILKTLRIECAKAREMRDEWDRRLMAKTIAMVDAARHEGWSWERIGNDLGISAAAVRAYYQRNCRRVLSGGSAHD